MKVIKKIKNFFVFLQSLPYEKRLYLLQISLVVVGLIGFLAWISIFSHQVSENRIALEEQNKTVPSKIDVFKKGIYAVYQDSLLPFLKQISQVLLSFFSFSVQVVIRIFNFASHLAQQILIQYKAYAQLIQHFLF